MDASASDRRFLSTAFVILIVVFGALMVFGGLIAVVGGLAYWRHASRAQPTMPMRPPRADGQRVYGPTTGGILASIEVQDGDSVLQDQVLARFQNADLENELLAARAILEIHTRKLEALGKHEGPQDGVDPNLLRQEIAAIETRRDQEKQKVILLEAMRKALDLRAPRAGVVMGLPKAEEVGKLWEKDREKPFCTISDRK